MPRFQCPLRHLQALVQIAQQQVDVGYLADQADSHTAIGRLRGKQSGAGRLGSPAILPPKIDLVSKVTGDPEAVIGIRPGKQLATLFFTPEEAPQVEERKLIGPHRCHRQPRLLDPGQGNPQIFILLQRRANQQLQLLVLEQFPPVQVGHRFSTGPWLHIFLRHLQFRSFIIRG